MIALWTGIILFAIAVYRGERIVAWIRARQTRERVLSPKEVREAEHEMGIGPFRGREDYCDLEKCTDPKDHIHEDIDEETQTGRRAPIPKPEPAAPPQAIARGVRERRAVPCESPDHEHEEILSAQGVLIRRICDTRHQDKLSGTHADFADLAYQAEVAVRQMTAVPSRILGPSDGSSITYANHVHEREREKFEALLSRMTPECAYDRRTI